MAKPPPRPPPPPLDEPLGPDEDPAIPPTIPAGRPAAPPDLEGLAASELKRARRRGETSAKLSPIDPSWFENPEGEDVHEVSQFEPISDTEAYRMEQSERPRRPLGPILKLAGAAVAVLALLVAGLAFQSHRRKQAVSVGLGKAEAALAVDTAAGYREASRLLEPLADIDPIEAGAARAFACAMLAADYRDDQAAD